MKPKIVLRDASEFEEETNGYVPGIQRDNQNESKQEKINVDDDFHFNFYRYVMFSSKKVYLSFVCYFV